MEIKSKIFLALSGVLLSVISMLMTSCDDEEFSRGGRLAATEVQADALLATAYTRWRMATYNNQGHAHAVQTFVGDLTMLPTRGEDWGDNNKWIETHQHEWSAEHSHPAEVWTDFITGLSESLTALNAYESVEETTITDKLGEAKALVAFNIYNMIDLFGKALYDRYRDGNTVILEGEDAIAEMEILLQEAMVHMDEANSSPANSNKFTEAAVWALYAKLYLNKAVYTDRYGTPSFTKSDMDTVYKYTSKIIELGAYAVETDYFRMFDVDNGANSEFILAVEQFSSNNRELGRNDIALNMLGRNQRRDLEVRGSNGGCLTTTFFNKWDQNDPRFFERHVPSEEGTLAMADYTDFNRGILHGQQYGPVLNEEGSAFLTDEETGELLIQELVMDKDRDVKMDFTPEVTDLITGSLNQGARVSKYQADLVGGRKTGGFDIPLIRISDIYLMRAEAVLRGADGDADADVNAVRTARVGREESGTEQLQPLSGVTLDQLLDERAFELYWEPHRRTDLIRFGKWEDQWTLKTNSDVNKRVLPIPAAELANLSILGLTQNQGYN